jgi:hypothetical protein
VNDLQEAGEILTIRNGKHTKSRLIRSKDILRRNNAKQLFFIQPETLVRHPKQKRRRKRKLDVIVMPNHEQLNLMGFDESSC